MSFVALMEADSHIMSLSDPLFSSQLASDASVCSTMTKKVVKLLDQFDPAYATPLEARVEAMVQLGLASGATFDDEACLSAHFYTPRGLAVCDTLHVCVCICVCVCLCQFLCL